MISAPHPTKADLKGRLLLHPMKGEASMKIRFNENQEIVDSVKEGLARTVGYCPCRLERSEENKCMCREFREQIKDPDFEGYCHCLLYYKEK